ncbi:MAG: hypothetical protein GDA43_01195 [Hormoscilla sp. SP5CHS1]|nr:hypothetical protein [Hormoscilla sp. SP12CHS1]MBC6451972.1 hypothetical protein [Hormoscilla sp. SP5CHS1]MBC6475200.1 hypothetical protein [Hormoscilla sp. GM102CHS1]
MAITSSTAFSLALGVVFPSLLNRLTSRQKRSPLQGYWQKDGRRGDGQSRGNEGAAHFDRMK